MRKRNWKSVKQWSSFKLKTLNSKKYSKTTNSTSIPNFFMQKTMSLKLISRKNEQHKQSKIFKTNLKKLLMTRKKLKSSSLLSRRTSLTSKTTMTKKKQRTITLVLSSSILSMRTNHSKTNLTQSTENTETSMRNTDVYFERLRNLNQNFKRNEKALY